MSMRLQSHLVRAALGSVLATCSLPALATNNCTISAVNVRPSQVVVNYDPFEASSAVTSFEVDLTTRGCPENRNLFLEFDPVDPSASNGTEIRFTNGSNNALVGWISDQRGGSGNGRDDFFNVKAGTRNFFVQLRRGQVVPPGSYRVTMQAEASLNNGRNTPDRTAPFDITVVVGAAVGLAPASGIGLQLGELRSGRTAASAVTFDAYANVPYRLSLASDRGFMLRLGGAAGGVGASYVPVLDGSALGTGSPRRDFARPATDWRRRHSLNVEVGSISGLPAGTYRDSITVEISARLGGD